jgi:16S rRNA (guanine966-N2)-methyltransferase
MRVIAGKFKGRQLVSFQADHIRPTTDRVKESIFNKLQGYFEDARVLDLFSGTGNLAIEALSRGAAEVIAVELSKKSIRIIEENLKKLQIQDEIQVVSADVLKYLKNHNGPAFDVIFIDPPFTEKMAHEVLQALALSSVMGEHTVAIIESSAHERLDDEYGTLVRFDQRDYGDKLASYFQIKGQRKAQSKE